MLRLLPALLAALLVSCGGGGPNAGTCFGSPGVCNPSSGGGSPVFPTTPTEPTTPEQPAATTANGIWKGTTNTGRSTVGVLLDDSTYWVLYTVAGNPNVIAGAVQGNMNRSGNTVSSTNGRDFNLEGLGINDANIQATYTSGQSLTGAIRYANSSVTFSSVYDPSFKVPASNTIIAGLYSWQAATNTGVETGTLSVTASGTYTGSTRSGCNFQGTVAPRPADSVYVLTTQLLSGCAPGPSTANGVAYFDPVDRRLWAAGVSPGRTGGFLLIGVKQ